MAGGWPSRTPIKGRSVGACWPASSGKPPSRGRSGKRCKRPHHATVVAGAGGHRRFTDVLPSGLAARGLVAVDVGAVPRAGGTRASRFAAPPVLLALGVHRLVERVERVGLGDRPLAEGAPLVGGPGPLVDRAADRLFPLGRRRYCPPCVSPRTQGCAPGGGFGAKPPPAGSRSAPPPSPPASDHPSPASPAGCPGSLHLATARSSATGTKPTRAGAAAPPPMLYSPAMTPVEPPRDGSPWVSYSLLRTLREQPHCGADGHAG